MALLKWRDPNNVIAVLKTFFRGTYNKDNMCIEYNLYRIFPDSLNA